MMKRPLSIVSALIVVTLLAGCTAVSAVHARIAGKPIPREEPRAAQPDRPWLTRDNYVARTTGRWTQLLTPLDEP